jgi:hypothetical protein
LDRHRSNLRHATLPARGMGVTMRAEERVLVGRDARWGSVVLSRLGDVFCFRYGCPVPCMGPGYALGCAVLKGVEVWNTHSVVREWYGVATSG